MINQCRLCAHPTDTGKEYCCKGCETVYEILEKKGEEKDFRETDLFQISLQEGIISNPDLLASQKNEAQAEVFRLRLEVANLFCASCAQLIEWVVLKQKGVVRAVVDYTTDFCVIEYCPQTISKEKILEKIAKLGYATYPLGVKPKENHLRLGVASFFTFNIMMFSYPVLTSFFFEDTMGYGSLFAYLCFFAALPLVTYCAYPIYRKAYMGLKHGYMGMELLVTLGVVSSFFLSTYHVFSGSLFVYFDTLSVILTFVLWGRLLEKKAKWSTKKALYALFRATPKKGRLATGEWVFLKDLKVGSCLKALTGEKIVVDGKVVEGKALLNTQLINGEALPTFVQKESHLLSGSTLVQGSLVYQTTKPVEGSYMTTLVELVEEGLLKKKKAKRVVDPFLHLFVPCLLLGAFIFLYFSGDWIRFLSILLISCPCAIGIAAPLAESEMIKTLLDRKVVVRNRAALALLGKEKHFVFDKTGTLTTGDLLFDPQSVPRQVWPVLKAMAEHSIHPICRAIVGSLQGVQSEPLQACEEHMGQGMSACDRYWLGSKKWVGAQGVEGRVFFKEKGKSAYPLTIHDSIRQEAPSVVSAFQGVKLSLVSGDSREEVERVAHSLGIEHYQFEVHPLEKKLAIESLQKEGIVGMCGDGINDAAALASADLSFAPFNAADTTREAADFFLTEGGILPVVEAREIGKKGRKIIAQNIFWAFFYNTIGISLAACGYLTPLFATGAMVVSSLMVMMNAKRVGWTRRLMGFVT